MAMDDSGRKRRAKAAEQIKDAMAVAGLSRKMLADRLGKSPAEVTRWLKGDHNFTLDLLEDISCALGKEITGVSDIRTGDLVTGYPAGAHLADGPEYLRDPEFHYCIPALSLPPASFRNIQRLADKAGLTLRKYAEKVLYEESKKGEPDAEDFCGILNDDFPSAEELRSMRTSSGIVEL